MSFGTNGPNVLEGTRFNDEINGLGGDDTIYGYDGNDILEGGSGADRLIGGDGTDLASYNTSNSYVYVNLATNTGIGGDAHGDFFSSIESLQGSSFNDTLIGNAANNGLFGGQGNDRLSGGAGNDRVAGAEGDDTLVGGAGADSIDGGEGTFDFVDYIDSASGVVVSLVDRTGQGGDAEGDTLFEVEQVGGSNFNDTLIGDGNFNFLRGNGGDDTLKGFGGADTLLGDFGNDTAGYLNSSAGVTVSLPNGNTNGTGLGGSAEGDVLISIENLIGSGLNDNLTGNSLGNRLSGANGDDLLDGRGGADDLIGGTGDDFYFVDHANDKVTEGASEGTADRVFASVSYTLSASARVERLTTDFNDGTAAIDLTGNGFIDNIFGNAGANVLNGKAGSDSLTGFGGADAFVFDAPLGAGNIDTVYDFNVADDTIRLEDTIFGLPAGPLAAGAFRIGAAASDGDDRVIYDSLNGALLFDPDGAGGTGATQFAALGAGLSLSSADFIVV